MSQKDTERLFNLLEVRRILKELRIGIVRQCKRVPEVQKRINQLIKRLLIALHIVPERDVTSNQPQFQQPFERT